MDNIEQLRFPIGQFQKPATITEQHLAEWQKVIELFPITLEHAAKALTDAQLDTPYRPEGWTLRQVVHHLADSHLNSFTRFKLALTEENPTIKPYREELWAENADAKLSIEPSLLILKGIHARWTHLLANFSASEWGRTFYHPESKHTYTLDEALGLYSWHCQHHLAHIRETKKRNNWE